MKRIIITVATIFLVGIGCFAIFVYYINSNSRFSECTNKQIASGVAKIGGSFELKNKENVLVTDTDIIREPSLIYFGYSFCPDICPYDLVRNATAVDILKEKGYSVTPIFITIDPERDTPERVGEFAEFMHPKMIGLSGNKKQIKNALNAYKVYAKKAVNSSKAEDYLMDHSTFTYFMHPEAGFLDYYNRSSSAEEIGLSVSCFLSKI